MSDLLWPGDHRAGGLLDDQSFLQAALELEAAWSAALVRLGIAPAGAAVSAAQLAALLPADVLEVLGARAEASGNPVVPLVALLREGLDGEPGRWLHRGLTSQDVVDTALMRCAAAPVEMLRRELLVQVRCLVDLVETHRHTPAVARTLTQHAVPTTVGLRAASWLSGVLDAHDDLTAVVLPVQLGGAAGTMAAAVELAGHLSDPVSAVAEATVQVASALGLAPSTPWHTVRTSVTRLGDAATRCTDAWGHVANDVLSAARSEVGELSEGVGGASSTMPHKANPTLSVLVRRAALTAPALGATLHAAAADATDERTAGGWHAEWSTLRVLLRRTVVAGSQTTDLLRDLVVHEDRAAELLAGADGVGAEQQAMAALAGREPAPSYLGATDAFLQAPLARAAAVLAEARA